jgi:hypothetical protein
LPKILPFIQHQNPNKSPKESPQKTQKSINQSKSQKKKFQEQPENPNQPTRKITFLPKKQKSPEKN